MHEKNTRFVGGVATCGFVGGRATERVSLVLEQYKVPVGSFEFTVQYEIVDPRVYRAQRFGE